MSTYSERISRVASALAQTETDTIFVTPSADLKYLTGYSALPLERLTCLAISATGKTWMIVPTLERPSAEAHNVEMYGIELLDWNETENPYTKLASAVGAVAKPLVNNLMWVEKAWHLQAAFGVNVELANHVLSDIRAVKTVDEVAALHEAGRAIDSVHSQMGQWLRPGRTEREVGRDIADAILQSGHTTVDFVIVASGPNGASPHHEVSDRIINADEPVVVDIGGTMPSGYCSDSTRTYVCGQAPKQYRAYYDALQEAQRAAVEYARPGVSCESVDTVARNILKDHGLGDYFIHRTGHGIGMETHEEPYIVSGNRQILVSGHAFSIEPGFYIPGKYGARIEDIVTCNDTGVDNANNTPRDLVSL
ncbi:MAG: Xaa-Pro peptidase family protein [Actinomycetes bacterium]